MELREREREGRERDGDGWIDGWIWRLMDECLDR